MIVRLIKTQSGATKLELVVVTIIIAILVGVYLRTVRSYQEATEQTLVSLMLSNIRTGMAQEWADRLIKGQQDDRVTELLGANPVRWLESPPQFYQGELKVVSPDRLKPGYWFFDLRKKELGYVVSVGENLEIDGYESQKVLRWRVGLEDNLKNAKPEFGDLVLITVTAYQWF